MTVIPNWQHHSKKEPSRTLKPQALRDARKRTKSLIKQLTNLHTHQRKDVP